MVRYKRIGAVMAVCIAAVVTTACGKTATITPGKEITMSDEEKKQADQMIATFNNAYNEALGRDDGGMGNTSFGKVTVSITCPQGWKVYAEAENYLWAKHNSYPKYQLDVEVDQILNKKYKNIEGKYIKKYKKFSAKNIKKAEKDFKKDYAWNLLHRGYPNWVKVEIGSEEFNGQYYITAKGKLKASNKKHEGKGIYRYVTICNGKLLRFTFTANNPNMDGSVIAIFDSIVETATYETD